MRSAGSFAEEAQLFQAPACGAAGTHHKHLPAHFNRFFHRVLHGECCGHTQVRDLREVKHHGPAVADGVVLAVNRLGNTKNHGAIELEQQHLAVALIQ